MCSLNSFFFAYDTPISRTSSACVNVWKPDRCGSIGKTQQPSTFNHILIKSLCSLLQGVIYNISIETSAGNQTAFICQSLVANAAFLLWAAKGKHLQNEKHLKDFIFTWFLPWLISKSHGVHLHSPWTWAKYFWVWHSSLLWTMHSFWWLGSCLKPFVPVILFKVLIP